MEKFTEEEKNLLMSVLAQLKVDALAPDAMKSVELIQSAARKIEANTEQKAEKSKQSSA